MRIDGQHGQHFVRPKSSRSSDSAANVDPSDSRSQPQAADTSNSKSQTLELVRQLRETPEIRENRLREVADLLRQNTYLNRQAADDTAAAILNAISDGSF